MPVGYVLLGTRLPNLITLVIPEQGARVNPEYAPYPNTPLVPLSSVLFVSRLRIFHVPPHGGTQRYQIV